MLDGDAAGKIIFIRSLVFLFFRDDMLPDRCKRVGQMIFDEVEFFIFAPSCLNTKVQLMKTAPQFALSRFFIEGKHSRV